MTNYLGQPCTPDSAKMDRKHKKPMMEKHRRDRMNKAMDCLKEMLISVDSSNSSKLEKADILERTVELMRLLLQRDRNDLPAPAVFHQGYMQGINIAYQAIARVKSVPPEANKALRDVIATIPGAMPAAVLPPPQNGGGLFASARPVFPGGPMVPLGMTPLMPSSVFPGPMKPVLTSTPKGIGIPTATTSTSTSTSALSRTAADSPGFSSDEEIDVTNCDDDDDSRSPTRTPDTPLAARKRQLDSTDDSGYSDVSAPSPKVSRPSGAFTISGLLTK